VQVCNTATPPECKDIHKGKHTTVRCGVFWEAGPSLGTAVGAGALGVGLAAGAGVGIAAGAGAFSNGSSSSKK
jgi:hypothetical protein